MHDDSLDALRDTWMKLFDRVVAAAQRSGRDAAFRDMLRVAQEGGLQDIGGLGTDPIARPVPVAPKVVRARSGHVQEIVLSTLEQSLVPLLPLKIVEAANAKDPQSPLKVSSTRMALAALKEKGRVVKNDLGEWTVAPRSTRPTLRAQVDPLMWDTSRIATQN